MTNDKQLTTNDSRKSWVVGRRSEGGFSLLELLIVIGLISIVGTAGVAYYRNASKEIELRSAAKTIASDLKSARAKSMAGEDDMKWGIHFVNSPTSTDYYELFKTPTDYSSASKTVAATTFLPSFIEFTAPAEGAGSGTVVLRWTNPSDGDFSNVVVLRNTAAIADVPTEGSSPAVDSMIGTSVVRYNSNSTSFIDTGLTGGTPYYYKIFTKDTSGNYNTGTAAGPFTPI